MINSVNTEYDQPKTQRDNIDFLRQLLADMREQQSSPKLNDKKKSDCKRGILALVAAIDALEIQVLA